MVILWIVLAAIVLLLMVWFVMWIIDGKPPWPLGKRNTGGAICPACGSRKTYLFYNKTAFSHFRVGRTSFNIDTPGVEDVWRCRKCGNNFKLR
jgi:hypothetical protein